jgi:hypothetical protein
LLVCPGVRTYGDGIPIEAPIELIPLDCRTPGCDLLVGWDRSGEDAPVAWAMKLTRYEFEIRLPGPFAFDEYVSLADRIVPAVSAALKRNRLGEEILSYTSAPGSEESEWSCNVFANELKPAIELLREVLAGLNVSPHARIDVFPNALPHVALHSYPLAPQADDWLDLDEVDRAARWTPEYAFAAAVPCW